MFFSMRLAINTYHLIKDVKKMQGEGAAAGGHCESDWDSIIHVRCFTDTPS